MRFRAVKPKKDIYYWSVRGLLKVNILKMRPLCFVSIPINNSHVFCYLHSRYLKTQQFISWPVVMKYRWRQYTFNCLNCWAIIWEYVNENTFPILSNAANLAGFALRVGGWQRSSGPRVVDILPQNPFTRRVALCMRANTKMNSVLSRIAHFLYNVNVNYK